ncbi:hypothetical protein [Streptomyces sp. NPDC058773]|uniref:hypothetical protein n=1 Tax=Streptomyces sp. NPDC058773 TaxID=3346632 RepID=UPI0036C50986
MPLDVFAALGALVRAEAARSRTKHTKPPAPQTPAQRRSGPDAPPVEPPDTAAAPAPGPAPGAPPAARKHPLARLLRKLITPFG